MTHQPLTLAPVDIVNRALAMIGGGVVMSLDTEGDLEGQCKLLFWTVVEYALGQHPWPFARRRRRLQQLAGEPETGFKYAYAFPPGALGMPLGLYAEPRDNDRPCRRFHVEAGEVHADEQALWADFIFTVEPTFWPPDFRMAVITLLASHLAVPVAHDLALAGAKRREAVGDEREGGRGGLLGSAINGQIANSPPAPGYIDDPLTASYRSSVDRGPAW